MLEQKPYISAPRLSFRRAIILSDISFSYPNSNRFAAKGVSEKLYRGETLGVVGKTGSGKTTMMNLLMGLIKPQKGSVLIDDSFSTASVQWHKKIGYVAQDPYIFDASLKHNVAFTEHASDINIARVRQVLRWAELHDLEKQLPQGIKLFLALMVFGFLGERDNA